MAFQVHCQQAASDQLAEDAAPFDVTQFLADAEGAEPVMSEAADALVALAH